MQNLTGHVFHLTGSENKKWAIYSEGKDVDEALSIFRDIHGYTHSIIEITYITKVGEIID